MKEEEDTEKKLIRRLKDVVRSGNLQAASEALILLEEEGEVDLRKLKEELKKNEDDIQ